MDIVGHVAIADFAGVSSDPWGRDALLALFPNIAHCHDWAYSQLQPVGHEAALIRTHIIADWVIHYGAHVGKQRRRIGWAYESAPWIADRMDGLFDLALKTGFSDLDPRDHDERLHLERDFAHTAAECALDLQLVDMVVDTPKEQALRASLSQLGDVTFARTFVDETFAATAGVTTETDSVLARTAYEYGAWAYDTRTMHDFPALTICSKLGWSFEPPVVDLVLEFLAGVGDNLDKCLGEQLIEQVVGMAGTADLGLDS